MLPYRDINPTRRFPLLTFVLIGINVFIFAMQVSMTPRELQGFFLEYGVIPRFAVQAPFSPDTLSRVLSSMFIHGSFVHIAGNMLYLYLFGDNVEDRLGKLCYLLLYMISGVAAVVAQVFVNPQSLVPMIGASGAIAGVLGSYIVLYPNVEVRAIIPLGWFPVFTSWPAWIVIGLWFVIQLFSGITALQAPQMPQMGGVAFFAHVGGFIAGMVLTWLFLLLFPQPPADQRRQMLYERARRRYERRY